MFKLTGYNLDTTWCIYKLLELNGLQIIAGWRAEPLFIFDILSGILEIGLTHPAQFGVVGEIYW